MTIPFGAEKKFNGRDALPRVHDATWTQSTASLPDHAHPLNRMFLPGAISEVRPKSGRRVPRGDRLRSLTNSVAVQRPPHYSATNNLSHAVVKVITLPVFRTQPSPFQRERSSLSCGLVP